MNGVNPRKHNVPNKTAPGFANDIQRRLLATSKRFLIIFLLLLTNSASAESWNERRSNLHAAAIYGDFRIFYTLNGKDALPRPRQVDSNNNNIPDFVEAVGERLISADNVYRSNVGLKSPLTNNRYKDIARFIDVNILDFSLTPKGPRNGVAYDGTPKFNRSHSDQLSVNVLAIDLSGTVKLESNSVEHELFHLYQNGYTFFKNRWYTEGTARWSELIVSGRVGNEGALPQTTTQKDELFQKAYEAKTFWNELITRVDKKSRGMKFIKRLLEQLDQADDIAARDRGLSSDNWEEKDQFSERNNTYIWDAVYETIKSMGYPISGDIEVDRLRTL